MGRRKKTEDRRLMFGDCLELMKEIPDNSIDMCLTDPPYRTTACKWDTAIDLEKMWFQLKRIVKDNRAIVLFGSNPFTANLIMSNLKYYKHVWIWEKPGGVGHLVAKYGPLKNHEDIVVFCNGRLNYKPQFTEGTPFNGSEGGKSIIYNRKVVGYPNEGKRHPKTVLHFPTVPNSKKLHNTQKPVPLLEYLIRTYSNENDTILDFTMGSGSTGVAARNLKRKFVGIEKDYKYFCIAKQRMEGKLPKQKK